MNEEVSTASRTRSAVFAALKAGAPAAFNDEMRSTFLTDGSNIVLAELDMDSLGEMEFCIEIELSTGVTLSPAEIVNLASTDAIEQWIREKLSEAPASGGETPR